MRDETSWIGVRHLFSREPLKRRDKNANLFCACTFVLYVTQRYLIIKAKYPPCRVKRGLKTLAYSQGRYPLCSFVQPTFASASHRDRATGGHSRGQGKRPAFPLQKPDPYFQLWVLYTRYHAQGRQCHCFFSLFFYSCAGVSLSASASVSLSASFAVSDAWSSS